MSIKKLRTYYWLVSEFFKRYYKVIFTSALFATFIFLALSLTIKHLPLFFPQKTRKIGLVGRYSPNEIPPLIKDKMSFGLIKLTPQGEILPGIASSWEIAPSGDKYTFTLTKLKWHNGEPVKPEDIKLPYKEVKTTYSSNSLTFSLEEPFSPFLTILSQPVLKNNKYGVGEYRLIKLVNKKGILEKIIIASHSQKLIYKLYPTENTALIAFKLGEIDEIEGLSFSPKDTISSQNTILTHHINYQKIATLFFNNSDPLLSNKTIRQALAYAIKDKAQDSERAISPISKLSWAFNPNIKKYSYNPEHAQKLFKKELKGSPPTLELYTTLPYLKTAESIAKSWKEVLGVKTNIKVTSTIPDNYQVLLIDFVSSLDPDQYSIWHSTQSTNFTHYHNLKVDKLLEDGRKTTDPKLRKEIYQDFQRFLLEDVPAIFLFYAQEYTLIRKTILPF